MGNTICSLMHVANQVQDGFWINYPGPNHQVFPCFHHRWLSLLTNGYKIFSVMIVLDLKGLLSIPAAKVGKLVVHSVGISNFGHNSVESVQVLVASCKCETWAG